MLERYVCWPLRTSVLRMGFLVVGGLRGRRERIGFLLPRDRWNEYTSLEFTGTLCMLGCPMRRFYAWGLGYAEESETLLRTR